MKLSQLIAWAREALNKADHAAAERMLEEINMILNGRANQ